MKSDDVAFLHALETRHGVDFSKRESLWDKQRPSPEFLPLARIPRMPKPWSVISLTEDGGAYSDGTVNVIASVAIEEDGRHWLHVSVTCRDGSLPSYEILCRIKNLFIGSHRTAIQVFPNSTRHVNIHPTCLHLWSCLDGELLPDFTRQTRSI